MTANLVTLTDPASPTAEAYRRLRVNLASAGRDAPLQAVLVVAAGPDNDKAKVVANLAVAFAKVGKQVIVADCDLHHPAQHTLFGLENAAGVTTALATAGGALPLQGTEVAGLRVLTSGPAVAVPADTLASPAMADLVARLRSQADVVLIDAAPVTQTTDAIELATQVDGVLLTVHAGQTKRDQAQRAKEGLEKVGARVVGVALVDAAADDDDQRPTTKAIVVLGLSSFVLGLNRTTPMKNLMVTGGAGFIGSNFVRYMLGQHPDINILVYDKLTYAGNLDNLLDVDDDPRYRFVKGDICDAEAVVEALKAHKIDTIVNFAAETHVDRSIMDPDAFIQTDVYGTYVLLEAARQLGLERYHQISTDEVYGHIHGDHRSLETDAVAPRSPYAASKTSGDLMAIAYFVTYGLPVTITRGANNIGPYQYPEKVIPLFVTNAIDNQSLPVYGDGKQRRDYQFVMDHCEGIDVVLQKGAPGEIYNVGTGSEMENLAMVEILLDELGKPASLIQHVEDRPGHDRRYCLNVDKLKALGWQPRHSHEEAIRQTVRWYVGNEWWWRKIKSGEFKEYYRKLYGNRKVIASA